MLASIDISAELPADPSAVYRAWTTPQGLTGWLAETATGVAREGESIELAWPSLGQAIGLEVVTANAPHQLTVAAAVGGDVQVQAVHFSPTALGTEVRIRHRAPDDLARGIGNGWRLRLRLLEEYLVRGGTRTQLTVVGTARGAEDLVFGRLLAASAGLSRALTLEPDGCCGPYGDEAIFYVLRRFPLAPNTHLIAGRLMTWNEGTDLEEARPTMAAIVERASDAGPMH